MIRTVEQYLESLRDGRVIYNMGERVKDVTTHPILRRVIMRGAMDWVLTNDPKRRDLFVTKNEEGEEVHFLWTPTIPSVSRPIASTYKKPISVLPVP